MAEFLLNIKNWILILFNKIPNLKNEKCVAINKSSTAYESLSDFFNKADKEREELTRKIFAWETVWKIIKIIPIGSYTIKIFDIGDSSSYTIAFYMKSVSGDRELTSKKVNRTEKEINSYITYLKKVYITNNL